MKKQFLGVWIPRMIWELTEISPLEKMLLTEITFLDGEEGCYATNAYFSEFLQIDKKNTSLHISKLKKLNLVVEESFLNGKRILRSKVKNLISLEESKINKAIKNSRDTLPETIKGTIPESGDTPSPKALRDNICINNKVNNNIITIEEIYSTYKEKVNKGNRLLPAGIEKIKTRLKTYTKEELLEAIEKFSRNNWWMENNKHRGVEWFFYSDGRIDQFLNLKEERVSKTINI